MGGELAMVAVAALLSACDGSTPPLESPSVCSGAWQTFVPPKPSDITSPLVYEDDILYYSQTAAQTLLAQPISGGAPSTLASTATLELWAEGDHLLYTQGNLGNQIFSLPLAGGTPELLLDGGAGRTNPSVALFHAFTPSDVYWTEVDRNALSSSVWHASRSGGVADQIGSVTFTDPTLGDTLPISDIALTNDGVLVATISGLASLVPFNGSPARPLANPAPAFDAGGASLLGLDSGGAYWLVPRPGTTAGADTWTVIVAPADGGPVKTFWQGIGPHAGVQKIWPDGQGNWVMIGGQLFDDQMIHAVIWLLDATGTTTRLGCSPGAENLSWIEVPVAVAPDAVYAITNNLDAGTYQIDRIAR